MTSIKLKLRISKTKDKESTLFFQVIHERVVRQIKTDYHIMASEWDNDVECIITPIASCPRFEKLIAIIANLQWMQQRIENIVEKLRSRTNDSYTADDIVGEYKKTYSDDSLVFEFMRKQSQRLVKLGRIRSSETCMSALKSFMKFRNDEDLSYTLVSDELMQDYEAWLQNKQKVTRNTSSYYIRQFRTYYHKAVEAGLTEDKRPFRHVYTGVDKTIKRAITYNQLKRIKELDLLSKPHLANARDMFMMSFYLRGMSFIDMAYLRKKDLVGGVISYRRRKTDQLLEIEWEKKMQQIVDSYDANTSQYLLPIITKEDGTERKQYQNAMMRINRALKKIAELSGISIPLSMYTSRHSWASIARNMKVDLPVISRALGHNNESTTRIYLSDIKNTDVDKANRRILKGL